MPMLASNYIPEGMTLVLQSENGVLGLVSISVERGLVIQQDLATRSIQTFSRATLSKKDLLTVPSEEGFVNCGYIFTEASDISLNSPPPPPTPPQGLLNGLPRGIFLIFVKSLCIFYYQGNI